MDYFFKGVKDLQQAWSIKKSVRPEQGLSSASRGPPPGKVRMLLVGMTGHGKSRLGSYLISPADTSEVDTAPFEFSESPTSLTQIITAKQVVVNGAPFEVVDTPGFGEDTEKDLEHTLQAVKYLQAAQELSAVVFVYRSGRFQEQGKRLVTFLTRLFGDRVIQTNLVLVVTHVLHTPSMQKEREKKGRPVDDVMGAMRKVVSEAFSMQTKLHVIDIDTSPNGEEAEQISLMRRDEIFRLVASLPPIKLCDLKIPKLQQFESEDQVEVAKLETEIKNKQEKMKTPNPDDQDILNQVQAKILEVGEEKQNIKQIEADLAAVNSEDVQKTGSKDGSRKRQYFSSEALRIEAESHYPVAHHTVHLRDQDQDDTVSTKRVDDFTWRMSVMPASGRFGTCEATLTVYSKMKDIKAGEVKQLQIRLETAKKLHAKLEQEIAEFKQKNEHLKQQFTIKITSEIAEAQAKMAVLKLDFMSIEEAHTRYKQLEAKLETGNVTKAVSLFDGK